MANKDKKIEKLELREFQAELKTARLKYNELYSFYSFAPIGYMIIDSDEYIIEANQKAAQLLDMSRLDLFKQKFSLLVHFDDLDIYYLYQQRLKDSNRQQSCSLRLKTGKGSFFHVQLQSVPRSSINDVSGQILLTMTDITELVQARHAVDVLNQELEQRFNNALLN